MKADTKGQSMLAIRKTTGRYVYDQAFSDFLARQAQAEFEQSADHLDQMAAEVQAVPSVKDIGNHTCPECGSQAQGFRYHRGRRVYFCRRHFGLV